MVNSESQNFVVKSPMKLNSILKQLDMVLKTLSLQRWIHFAETDTYDIPQSHVKSVTASLGLTRFYDYCVMKSKKEDGGVLDSPNQ